MFLVNSHLRDACCSPACAGQALSLSYGHFFAEFLNEGSLVHLGTIVPGDLCRFTVRLPKDRASKLF